jgi:HK97 family phage major capsid protein
MERAYLEHSRHVKDIEARAAQAIRREERERYSLVRAIEALTAANRYVVGHSFEREVSRDLERTLGTRTSNSILVPIWALQRDLTAASAAGGGHLVETEAPIESLAQLLRGRSVIASMPVTKIPGLQAGQAVPVETAGPTAYALPTEASQITASSGSFVPAAASPKTIGAVSVMSNNFAKMTGMAGEQYVRRSLISAIGQKLDELALNGSGSNGEPYGIIQQISGTVTGTSLDEAKVREFQTDCGAALGPDCAFAATQAVASLLNGRQRFTGSDRVLWEGNVHEGQLGGWPARSSPNMPSGHLIFGAWASVILAEWGEAIELALNPYEDFKAGKVSIRAMATLDVVLTRPAAFSKATAVT